MSQPDHDTQQQVHDLLHRLTTAERDGDAGALAALLDKDFAGVGPLGFVLTKEQWLAGYRTGDLQYQALSTDQVSARRYSDTVITISVRTQQATYQGQPAPGGPFRVTHILVARDGGWLVAGFHISAIAAPPAAGRGAGS